MCAAAVSGVPSVTDVRQDTSTTRSANCVAAAASALFPKFVMRPVAVCANKSFKALAVNSADLDFTLIQTAKSAAVTSAPLWTPPVPRPVTATVVPTTADPPVSSVHLVTTVTPAAHPASAPPRAPATPAVTTRRDGACVCPVWWDRGVTAVLTGLTASPTATRALVIPPALSNLWCSLQLASASVVVTSRARPVSSVDLCTGTCLRTLPTAVPAVNVTLLGL